MDSKRQRIWNVYSSFQKSTMYVLNSEKCCGLYSVRVGALIIISISFLFSSCIMAIEFTVEQQTWNELVSRLQKDNDTLQSNEIRVSNNINSVWDVFFAGAYFRFFPLWIFIPAVALWVISAMGLLGILLEWSLLLLPYFLYRACWFLFCFIALLPLLILEFLILLILSCFPDCPSFLKIFTWIIKFMDTVVFAFLAVELVIIIFQFHLMTVIVGCYQQFKASKIIGEEEPDAGTEEVFDADSSMHIAVESERRRNYQTVVHKV